MPANVANKNTGPKTLQDLLDKMQIAQKSNVARAEMKQKKEMKKSAAEENGDGNNPETNVLSEKTAEVMNNGNKQVSEMIDTT